MSADLQNKIINSIEKQLQKFIVGEINAAGIYSIAMDCTTDSSHADQLYINYYQLLQGLWTLLSDW